MESSDSPVITAIRYLTGLHPGLHWLCHRSSNANQGASDPSSSTLDQRIEATIVCMELFVEPENNPTLELFQDKIARFLDCQFCVKAWHNAKKTVRKNYEGDYAPDVLDHFVQGIDNWDYKRILTTLLPTETALRNRKPGETAMGYINNRVYVAIYDCMFVPQLLDKYNDLAQAFITTFSAIQEGGRHMGMAESLPALCAFLFMQPVVLKDWAVKCLQRMAKPIGPPEYDNWLQQDFKKALSIASSATTEWGFMTRFWSGTAVLIEALDKSVIVSRIAGSDCDIFRALVSHLQWNSPHLLLLLRLLKSLLTKTNTGFWEAVGSMPPTVLLELIFNNPKFDETFLGISISDNVLDPSLVDLTSWVGPFVGSLNLSTRPQACASLLFQFLQRLQDNRFPIEARQSCVSIGLSVLDKTFELFQGRDFGLDEMQHQGNRIILREIISLANSHIQVLLKSLSQVDTEDRITALSVFQSILRMECRIFQADFKSLLRDNTLSPSAIAYSPGVWGGLYDSFPTDDFEYARMILCATSDLTSIEKLVTKGDPMNEPARLEFNKNLGYIKTSASNFLNRIAEYDALVLKKLFADKLASTALIFSLFDPYQENYLASADILKQAFGTLEKLKALMGLLMEYFDQTLVALDHSISQLRDLRTFGPMPRFLKTSDNILEIFCCPRSGLLSLKRVELNDTQKLLIRQYWNNQWATLGIIFDNAIKWSQIYEKEVMVEFTRDVMDYAGKLFSELRVFEKALTDTGETITIDLVASPDDQVSGDGRQLLSKVSMILSRVASWLRLRDEALLSMCQSLLCLMLKKFHNASIPLGDDALDICQNMAVGTRKKYVTNMTDQQKLELRLAVGLHRPIDIVETEEPTPSIKLELEEGPIVEPPPKRLKSEAVGLDSWVTKSKDTYSSLASPQITQKQNSNALPPKASLVKKEEPNLKRSQRASISTGSSLLKSIKADVRSDIKARNMVQPPSTIKSITSTEGVKLKTLNALIIPQVDKPQRVMQEEDSSSSDEQEDIGNDVFAIPKSIKPAEKPKGPRRTGFIGGSTIFTRGPLGDPGPRQAQSAADIRARLTPDLTPLFRSILSWNFFHAGDLPPNSTKTDYSMVTQSFRSAKEYEETFEPLLLLECWQQIVTAREEAPNASAFDIKVVARGSADSFIEIQANVPTNILATSDIVLVSQSQSPATGDPKMSCLALVQSASNRRGTHAEISLRCLPNSEFIPAIRPQGNLRGIKVLSLTPIEREYAALKALRYYHLCEQIIKGRPHVHIEPEDRHVSRTMKVYHVNKPQARAIIGAVRNDGFSLIQGPPGTGKTKTVIAVIGALLPEDKGVTISIPGSKQPSSGVVSKKLLVCAPSNAAVDELVIRLKEGVVKQSGDKFTPAVVRLGRLDVINQAVHDVALETLVEKKINFQKEKEDSSGGKSKEKPNTIDELRPRMDVLLAERKAKWAESDQARSEQREPPLKLREEIEALTRKIKDLGRQLDEIRDQSAMVNRNNDIRRREFMQQVLDEAHILCATLSGAGHDTLRNLNVEFETVIIDEAAQSIELSALIPMKFGCKKCIMVGDPKQLPPTVLSREASKFAYEQSLFVRMQKNHPESVHLLSIQYRMHPAISSFPSEMFYNSQLEDGPDMMMLRSQPWHQSLFFGPYRFFNVVGQEAMSGHSMKNIHEVNVALMIYKRLVADFPETNFSGKIGIITPYKTQLHALRQKFVDTYNDQILRTIEFNTTDAFQGREREIIIFSCVRASQKSTIGFLSDIRRMNVGLTRARSSLFVLGNANTLKKNEFWASLVENAQDRGYYTEGNFEQLLRRPCRTTMKQIEKSLSGVSISPADASTFKEKPSPKIAIMERDLDNPVSAIVKDETMESSSTMGSSAKDKVARARARNAESQGSLAVPKTKNNIEKSKKRHREEILPAEKTAVAPIAMGEALDAAAQETGSDTLDIPSAKTNSNISRPPPNPTMPTGGQQPRRPMPGSRGPLPPKKKKNVEDAMFIKRKPPRP
ncbi:DEAD-box type RNA helicase [Orbilia oligospora]|uniref:DEAD-box type RNA helicase n=1 Tax=Orbilia oligospora TaxID=2813651 RepID=A0A7C8NQJ0_ORBOL|nr:DEAD-box type RNA helicase [Orbilia oligospora]KAF3122599.1 DEAD-box type RNA helicase [Orbilia oligospora]KAF3127690.1 DEAD-box type RNA helicase [Orbilia oligospora]KAF3129780.1 DEAD-box type RNA helicase [Orbilia oligospora]